MGVEVPVAGLARGLSGVEEGAGVGELGEDAVDAVLALVLVDPIVAFASS